MDYESTEYVIKCDAPPQIVKAISVACKAVSSDTAERLEYARRYYLRHEGLDGLFRRMNNKSVREILERFEPAVEMRETDSGIVDGIKYRVFRPDTKQRTSGLEDREPKNG